MSVQELSSFTDTVSVLRTQVCVIGAGLAGYAVASKLADRGKAVVVLESGDIDGTDEACSTLNAIDNPLNRYSRAESNRSRGLGGTSRVWGGRMIPISPFETRPRPFLGEAGWPIDVGELSSFDGEVEALFALNPGNYEREPRQRGRSPRFLRQDPGIHCRWAKIASFGRRNLQRKWMKLSRSPRVEVVARATVTRLHVDRQTQRVDWVEAGGFGDRKVRVIATHFVLATGTLEATRLMLWTRQQLQQPLFGGPVLGHYFQDHLRIDAAEIPPSGDRTRDSLLNYTLEGRATLRGVHFELTEEVQQLEQVYGAFAYVQMDLRGHPLLRLKEAGRHLQQSGFDVHTLGRLASLAGPFASSLFGIARGGHLASAGDATLRVFACVEQQPSFRNRIALGETTDELGVPLANISWSPNEQDGRAFKALIRQLDSFWVRAGFDKVAQIQWHDDVGEDPSHIVRHARDAAHPSGSTRMGHHSSSSVVSPQLIAHDTPNLSIVSASVFPTAGSANPTFTLMRMAMWHAEFLVRSRMI